MRSAFTALALAWASMGAWDVMADEIVIEAPDDVAVAEAMKALKVADGETVIFVEDLHCATCAKKVTSRLFKMKGVKAVRTSVKYDAAVVTPTVSKPFDAVAAWEALQAIKYQPTRLVGPQGVYVAEGEKKAPLKVAEGSAPARR